MEMLDPFADSHAFIWGKAGKLNHSYLIAWIGARDRRAVEGTLVEGDGSIANTFLENKRDD